MRIIENPVRDSWNGIVQRPAQDASALESIVHEVFQAVKKGGDDAIRSYSEKFDGIAPQKIILEKSVIRDFAAETSDELQKAISIAKNNIEAFHKAQESAPVSVKTMPGVRCWQEKRPIEKVGLYIPGGTAPLFSTVLMLAIPAMIAGCKELVLCTPPDKDGMVAPAICYAAQLCGIDKIYTIGGIQAIAAMTFGSETVPAVYKIFGPGNQYVTKAKQVAMDYQVAIDMPAGPSEVMVVADDSADADFIASDLLSQAEHGSDSQVIMLSNSLELLQATRESTNRQLNSLPRKKVASEALSNSSLVYLSRKEDILDLMNAYAPEHLIICSRDESYFLDGIRNAGSVFLGNYTPESAGDYASGTNHTLPTNGYAKQYSGVNLDSFMKSITFQRISAEGLKNLGPEVEVMAEAEGLQAHKNAISVRLEKIRNS